MSAYGNGAKGFRCPVARDVAVELNCEAERVEAEAVTATYGATELLLQAVVLRTVARVVHRVNNRGKGR